MSDQIISSRQILQRTRKNNIDTYYLFINVKSAYGTINNKKSKGYVRILHQQIRNQIHKDDIKM